MAARLLVAWLLAASICALGDDACDDPSRAPELVAAYYINRDRDVERHEFMNRTLRAAGIRPVRVPAIEPPVEKIRTLLYDSSLAYENTSLVKTMRSQRHCIAATRPSRRGQSERPLSRCVHPIARNPMGCVHLNAYGPNMTELVHVSTSVSSSTCGRLIASYLSALKAVRSIHDDSESSRPTRRKGGTRKADQTRAPRPDERYYLLMEDDSMIIPEWRQRLCRFLRISPAHTWDIAKVDVDEADQNPRVQVQRKRVGNLYTREELAVLRADPIAWANNRHVSSKRVPFAYGMAAVLLRESAVPHLLALMEDDHMFVFDLQVAKWSYTRALRVALTRDRMCDPNSPLQRVTTLGKARPSPGGNEGATPPRATREGSKGPTHRAPRR